MAYNPFLRKRLASGYGDYLSRTPQTSIWNDFIDTDGDGIDDRYQAGQGQRDFRNQFQTPPQGFVQRPLDQQQQTNQYPRGRMPDFESYVRTNPDLLKAYQKKYGDDMSKLMPWGRQHWRKHGKEAGRDMQFQAAPKYDPSLFEGKKTAGLQGNKIASRYRRMIGAPSKTLKSGAVIPGYNP